jgi:hypothetical protein
MAEPGRYLVGERFKQKLEATIEKVDSLPLGRPVTRIPTFLDGGSDYVAPTFRIATFTGTWPIGGTKTVTFKYGTTATAVATNLFAGVTATSTVDCAVATDGTAWFLIAARC